VLKTSGKSFRILWDWNYFISMKIKTTIQKKYWSVIFNSMSSYYFGLRFLTSTPHFKQLIFWWVQNTNRSSFCSHPNIHRPQNLGIIYLKFIIRKWKFHSRFSRFPCSVWCELPMTESYSDFAPVTMLHDVDNIQLKEARRMDQMLRCAALITWSCYN